MLAKDLKEFVALLNATAVEYVIVGGHAVGFHGHPRYTGDIDFLIRPSPENIPKLQQVLEQFGFTDLDISTAEWMQPGLVVQLGHPPNRIDLLNSISGVEIAEIWPNRVAAELDGLPIHFLGLQELLRNKAATGRAKDAGDVEELLAVQRHARPPANPPEE